METDALTEEPMALAILSTSADGFLHQLGLHTL